MDTLCLFAATFATLVSSVLLIGSGIDTIDLTGNASLLGRRRYLSMVDSSLYMRACANSQVNPLQFEDHQMILHQNVLRVPVQQWMFHLERSK